VLEQVLSLTLAVFLLLARAALSQRDVPTRTSYAMGVGSTGRANRRRKLYGSTSQSGIFYQPCVSRSDAGHLLHWITARAVGSSENYLRPCAAIFIPPYQTAEEMNGEDNEKLSTDPEQGESQK
jgi:hypothetical protein